VVLGEAKALEDDPLRDYRLRAGLSGSREIRGFKAEGVESEKTAAAPTTSFYQAFWKPLETAIGSTRRVYVSTDGVLNQVALGVVPDNAGQLLMEKYDLRIVSSTKDVLRQRRASTGNTAVVVGNPLFALDEAQQRLALRALSQTEQTAKAEKAKQAATPEPVLMARAGQRSRELRGGTLNPLPGTQKEAEAVSKLLQEQRWSVGLYTQENALEERVKGVQSPRVLHLATHGFFESDQERKQKDLARGGEERASGLEDPMLRSGLYLTGANRALAGRATPSADMDDGVLTAYEATQINLQGTELVVLSACETGLGESQNGEGVFGLRRALQEAGAETVLMSMWSVPDRETQELMTLFYRNWLAGKDKHEALREAQSELRATVMARYGRDLAYYWGAFVLVGR
jgi:CHAT domain-containing protein